MCNELAGVDTNIRPRCGVHGSFIRLPALLLIISPPVLEEFSVADALSLLRLSVSSCIFLTLSLTLTAVHMAQCICHHHLTPAGGGKTASSLLDCIAHLGVYSFFL